MYDMYPEWGPAAHDPTHPLHPGHPGHQGSATATDTALQTALDLRDNGGERPDDN